MSVLGTMFRWGSMTLGALVVAWSAHSFLMPGSSRATPEVSTSAELLARSPWRTDTPVRVDALLDPSTRVFDSCLNRPAFTPTDTTRRHPFDPFDAPRGQELVGATVVLDRSLAPARIECVVLRHDGEQGERVSHTRLLSPVEGTSERVWVLSPQFRSEAEADAWHARGSFTGPLSRFDDLRANAAGLAHEASEIRAFARNELGVQIPAEATVVLDGGPPAPGAPAPRSYVGVAGTDRMLIVASAPGEMLAGPIAGMIIATEGSEAGRIRVREVAAAMGAADPARAVLVEVTPRASSAVLGERLVACAGLAGGLTLFGLGAWGTLGPRRSQGDPRRASDGVTSSWPKARGYGAVSPEQAMALGIPTPGTPVTRRPLSGPPSGREQAQDAACADTSPEDAILEAEMARWTTNTPGRRAA